MKYLTYLFPSIILLSVSLSIYSGQISKVNNIDIWWDSFGEETDPPLLMIMGLNANSQHWPIDFIKELVDKDLYVVIYDNRDTGKSTWINNENFFVKLIKISPNFIKKWLEKYQRFGLIELLVHPNSIFNHFYPNTYTG